MLHNRIKNIKCVLTALACFSLMLPFTVPLWAADAPERADEPVAHGIDISRWQGEVDFEAVAADGIDFVIMRAGFTGTKDSNFETYYEGAKEAGLEVGAYIYTYAETVVEAVQDARDMARWLNGKTFEYPIYFDIEDDAQSGLTIDGRTELCLAFLSEMRRYGFYAGVYANQNWYNNYLDRSRLEEYPLWLARWPASGIPDEAIDPVYGMWQYTSTGAVNGINGNVDLDVCYADYPTYIKESRLNGYGGPYDIELPFTDVKTGAWYYESVKYAYDYELVNGMTETLFVPEGEVTRGMFVTMLGRMSGTDTGDYTVCSFLDVDMTRYYGAYIAWAYEQGIVDGIGHGMFAPDDPITREQMCKIICMYAQYRSLSFNGEYASFADEDEISAWAVDYVHILAGAKIIEGMGANRFAPKEHATRAQCATILVRVHKAIPEKEIIPPENIFPEKSR